MLWLHRHWPTRHHPDVALGEGGPKFHGGAKIAEKSLPWDDICPSPPQRSSNDHKKSSKDHRKIIRDHRKITGDHPKIPGWPSWGRRSQYIITAPSPWVRGVIVWCIMCFVSCHRCFIIRLNVMDGKMCQNPSRPPSWPPIMAIP